MLDNHQKKFISLLSLPPGKNEKKNLEINKSEIAIKPVSIVATPIEY